MSVGKVLKIIVVLAALAFAVSSFYPGHGANAAGSAAPDFEVLNESGGVTRLSYFKGRPVVINFWATWCPPCRQELPDFNKLAAEYADSVEFMMVNLTDGSRETVESVRKFTEKNGYSFPVYFDTKYSGASAYGIRSIPTTVVVDADGNIAAAHIGAMSGDMLRGYIEPLIN